VLLLAMMNFSSHGTQDIYPTFLQHRGFAPNLTAIITIVSMVGAIIGGFVVGFLSDRYGRRRAMAGAMILGLILIPFWVLSSRLSWIFVGAFLMQFMVQGAWGAIPAHINELSPARLRGFFPGFAYQLGVLVAASSAYIEARMSDHIGYGAAMAIFAAVVMIVGATVISAGPEAHRISFVEKAETLN